MCKGQKDSIAELQNHSYGFKLCYNSSLIYPGVSMGAEYSVTKINIQKKRKNARVPFFTRAHLISANLNFYHQPDFHDNLYLTVEWVMRRTNKNGFISEFSCGPGYSRTFLGGTTYSVNDNGAVSIVKNAGYSYALITAGGGFGYDFSVRKKRPVSAYSKMNMIFMIPYNSTVYFRPVLELGIRFTLQQ